MINKEVVEKGGNFVFCAEKMKCRHFDLGSGCVPTLGDSKKKAPCEVIEDRFSYHSPKTGQNEKYEAIRNKAKELSWLIENECPESREKATSQTKLQEVVMWANASVAINS